MFVLFAITSEAQKDKFHTTYFELNEAISESDEQSANIDDYNIARQFEYTENGEASWYGKPFHNRKTASGEIYDMYKLTAAHKFLPFGTIVKVTNKKTGEAVLLRITDRGPYVKDRIIDLSFAGSQFISGSTNPDVKIEALLHSFNKPDSLQNTRYFFGYSLEWPLVCLPETVIDVIGKDDEFEVAFEKYLQTKEENPGQFVFLFSPSDSDSETFYVGVFRPEILNNINEFVEK